MASGSLCNASKDMRSTTLLENADMGAFAFGIAQQNSKRNVSQVILHAGDRQMLHERHNSL